MYEKVGLNKNGFKHLDNVSLNNGSVGGLGPNIRIDVYINLFDDFAFRKLRNQLREKVALNPLSLPDSKRLV